MNAPHPKLRTRKCVQCKKPFTPFKSFQKTCMETECLVKQGRVEALKRENKERKAKREKLKTRTDWIKDAQVAFNAYIRERDGFRPCICCGRADTKVSGLKSHGWDCGHYRSVGSAPHLRFDERNAHRQLVLCNRYGAGRAVDYRIGLIARIGIAEVEALEADQSTKKWSIPELKEIRDYYRQKTKDLRKQRESHFDPSREMAYELNNPNLKPNPEDKL
jgi:hypothetical protein